MIDVQVGDIREWASEYKGVKFHSLLCDPPYHLTSIVKRFGKAGSAPAKHGTDGVFRRASRGFMGQQWDGGEVAFLPETWKAIGEHLYDGAFCMAFSAARNYHLLASAIERAGFVIHPMIAWVNGQGFPKATRVDKGIDRALGVEQGSELGAAFYEHRYGLQALKPAVEPVVVFQKPYSKSPIDNIMESGAGTINIGAGRLDEGAAKWSEPRGGIWRTDSDAEGQLVKNELGRWPANVVFSHKSGCKRVGWREAPGYAINRFSDGMKPFGDGAGHEYESEARGGGQVGVWECEAGCVVAALDRQGLAKSLDVPMVGGFTQSDGSTSGYFFVFQDAELDGHMPFVYVAKASVSEREAGLSNFDSGDDDDDARSNDHPTLKPLALTRYLAGMLLPPPIYEPRRILVPFAGVMSEALGAWQAGWDEIVAIELREEYAQIGRQRVKHYTEQGHQPSLL